MSTVLTCLCTLLIAACIPGQVAPVQAYVVRSSPHTRIDLGGRFGFSSRDELVLVLTEPCRTDPTEVVNPKGVAVYHLVPCNRDQLDGIRVLMTTPWHSEVFGAWADADHLAFRVDWEHTGLDPLASNAANVVAQPWTISGTRWMPNDAEVRRILQLIGNATGDTNFEVVAGGAAPNLEVTRFEADRGALRAGNEAPLTIQIANRGPGTAYRVVATTRSSLASLHGQRIDFGRIKPGTVKTRQLRLTVPVSEHSPDAMLVLVISEGNGFSPHNISRRVPIAAATRIPVLAVHCSIPGHGTPQPDLDAGEDVVLYCMVDNSGTEAARAEFETRICGVRQTPPPVLTILPGEQAAFDIPMTIPHGLAIDSTVEIEVIARDPKFGQAAGTRVVGAIRKPALCMPGQLTRAQYYLKIAALREELAAGDLTPTQFDRYDAELVTCLN